MTIIYFLFKERKSCFNHYIMINTSQKSIKTKRIKKQKEKKENEKRPYQQYILKHAMHFFILGLCNENFSLTAKFCFQ